MSNPRGGEIRTVVIQTEPGRILVKVADPKPEPDQIEFFLRRTIEDWFADHPKFVIDKSETVMIDGETPAMNVWYHEKSERTPEARTYTIDLHPHILPRFGREYVEALIEESLEILRSDRNRQGIMLIVNSRRIALLLDDRSRQATVLPVELLWIDAALKASLEDWLAAPRTPLYVTHIPVDGFRIG